MNRLLIVAISIGIMFAFWSFLCYQSQQESLAQKSNQYDRAIPLFATTEELVREYRSNVATADSNWTDKLSSSDAEDPWGSIKDSSNNQSQAENDDNLRPDNVVVCSASWGGKRKSLEQLMRFVFELKAHPIQMNLESVECTAVTSSASNASLNASRPETWNCQVTAKYLSEATSDTPPSKNQ